MLLMPAHLVRRSEDEMKEYGEHFRLPRNLRIMSYQKLSQANAAGTLGIVPPDLFILNEFQKIKNRNAAVSRRVIRHMAQFPDAKFVAVTGTPVTKGLMDFGHVARWCVKPPPVPMDNHTMQEWADALDEKPGSYNQRDPGALLKLCNEEELREEPLVAARRGFRRRLTETPGVVATTGEDQVCTASGDPVRLEVRALRYEQDPVVEEHFRVLRDAWMTPSGWTFSMAMAVWAHSRTLALGLHYAWIPEPEGGPEGPWCIARKKWAKFAREAIKNSRVLDSELMVVNAVDKGALDGTELNGWRSIRATYVPSPRAVWHCDGALEACQRWAKSGPGVIWTDHVFFSHELSKRTGCKYFGPGGLDKGGNEIEKADPNSCVIASRAANSTGRNIQFWSRNLITAAPMNASEWEQLLGRTHRHGQRSDVVTVDVLMGCAEHVTGWNRSVALADMTRDVLGAPQKLLIATSDFPSDAEVATWPGAKWASSK